MRRLPRPVGMRVPWWAGVMAGLTVAVVLPAGVRGLYTLRDERAFQEQLRLARSEGIPTTGAEFAAHIRPAKPEENAAELYRKLDGRFNRIGPIDNIDLALIFHADPRAKGMAEATLRDYEDALKTIDQAMARPRCWFNRPWSDGAAVLFPELGAMRGGARLLMLQGTLAAENGDPQGALAALRKTYRIADHIGEEPTLIARNFRETTYRNSMRQLAYWSYANRGERAYLNELQALIDRFPRPNLREEHLGDLLNVISLVDMQGTAEGRAKLGLKDDDISMAEGYAPLLLPRGKSKIEIVKAQRSIWAALDLPPKQRAPIVGAAYSRQNMALFAYPMASRMVSMLSDDNGIDRREDARTARLQEFTAALRALRGRTIAGSIDVGDLPSPYDGSPLHYDFDGKQIKIDVSGFGNRYSDYDVLLIPPKQVLDKRRPLLELDK